MGDAPVLAARGLVKRFGAVTALDGTDFDLQEGEVLGIVGDNGAGKSSLLHCLAGVYRPDEGAVELGGEPVRFDSIVDARAAGIELTHPGTPPGLDIDRTKYVVFGPVDYARSTVGSIRRALAKQGVTWKARGSIPKGAGRHLGSTDSRASSGAGLRIVEVARARQLGIRIVLMDEPTAGLGQAESRDALALIRACRDRGLSVVMVSHNMAHVFEVADRIHIQRSGVRAAMISPATHTPTDALASMSGTATN